MRTPGSRRKEQQPLPVPPCPAAQVGVCPGLPHGLGWAAGSFPSLPCSLPSPLPSSESPCIPCPRWNKQSSRLWGRAIGALPCQQHAMTPLLFPLLLASLLPSSFCNKGECGGGGWGHRGRGSQAPRCGGRGGQAPFKAPWDTTGGSSHHPPSHPFSQTCPLLFSLASPEPLSGPSSLVRLYPCASLAPRLVPIPILGSVSPPPLPPPPLLPAGAISGLRRTCP